MFVSENMKNFYMSRYNLKGKSVNVIPTVVNDKFFFKDTIKREKIRKELGVSDEFVFLYVGGVQKWQYLESIVTEFEKAAINNNISWLFI